MGIDKNNIALKMELRKQKEIEYYDKKAEELNGVQTSGDFEGFQPRDLASYKFLYRLLKENCQDKLVLDFGCGNGVHSFFPLKAGAKKVIGIDLSEKSLEIARELAKKEEAGNRVEFIAQDCEKMDFSDNYFDIILDGGTFSSLDLKKALPELARVLKPKGLLIGIETFGHNPLTNLKRRINKITGKRTLWATEHIFRQEDLKLTQNHFDKIEVYYFHLISWLAFPFLRLKGARLFLSALEFFDRAFLSLPFLRKYAFKVVFIFRNPKK